MILTSQTTLLAYVFVLFPGMLLGFFFARRKMFVPHHKFVMTAITLINWVLIAALMAVSYTNFVAPALAEGSTDIRNILPLIHAVTGGLAQLLATYLVILMWTENTSLAFIVPKPLRTTKIKTPMRLTLTLWVITVLLGTGIFVTWNASSGADDVPPPAQTEEAPDAASTEEADAQDADDEDAPAPDATEESADERDTDDDDDASEPNAAEDADGGEDDAPEPDATEDA